VSAAWRPEVALPLAIALLAYAVGWARLARRAPARLRGALIARLGLALGGLVVAAVALLGLHEAAHERFPAHMAQHVLLMMIAVPAVLLADPLPAALWALPAGARARVGRRLRPSARARRAWHALTRLPVAWTLWAGTLGFWHLPAAYDAALAGGPVHDLAHVTLVAAAVVFWWPVIVPAPRPAVAPGAAGRVAYLVLAALASSALGVALAASPAPLYAYPPPPGGASLLEDQARGGVLMWAVGGAVDMAAVLALLARMMGGERVRASLTARGA
jgi:cytochrome c oxidase assembly factor CtaG